MRLNIGIILFAMIAITACKKEEHELNLPMVVEESMNEFPKLVLIETNVSVNCGACPLGHHKVDQLEDRYPLVNHISHYLFGPLHHPYSEHHWDKFSQNVFTPSGHIMREAHESGEIILAFVDEFEDYAKDELEGSAMIMLEVETDLGEGGTSVKVDLTTSEALDGQDLLLTVMLVEDEVTGIGPGYDQKNYGDDDPDHPYYQQGDYIEGFVHTNVIREVLTSFDGDLVSVVSQGATFEAQIDLSLLQSDPKSYSVVAFATANASGTPKILNSVFHRID